MMPMEYWRDQIFIVGKVSMNGFWIMSAITNSSRMMMSRCEGNMMS